MAEEVEKHKKPRRRATVHFYENMNKPSRSRSETLAELRHDEAEECVSPDVDKSTVGNPYAPRNYSADRLSEPVTAGHAASSTGNHNIGAGRNAEIAAHHPSLQQQAVTSTPLASIRSVNGDNQFGDRSITHETGSVNVARLDLASAAGARGPLLPSGHPSMHGNDHQSRGSATPPTPGHPLGDPTSHAVKGASLGGRAAMELLRQNARDALGPG